MAILPPTSRPRGLLPLFRAPALPRLRPPLLLPIVLLLFSSCDGVTLETAKLVASGTCESNGYRSLYDTGVCAAAAAALGYTDLNRAYAKASLKHCAGNTLYSSNTADTASYSAARAACDANPLCSGIYDGYCDSKGPFSLCKTGITLSTSSYSCVYNKAELPVSMAPSLSLSTHRNLGKYLHTYSSF